MESHKLLAARLHEITIEVRVMNDEAVASFTYYARRDRSTGAWDMVHASLEALTVVLGGCQVVLPIDAIESRCDRDAISREAALRWNWSKAIKALEADYQRVQEINQEAAFAASHERDPSAGFFGAALSHP